jgi:N,N'-diacetyllegionaminate synthase
MPVPGAFTIADRPVGPDAPPLVIGEVAQAHDGSLGIAHAFVDAIADAGADAVKFQTHIAEAESTPAEEFRVAFSRQDASRFDYWKRTGFDEAGWIGLAEHARERGLIFLSSPFSLEAVDLLERVGVPAWKIGSGEVSNTLLLDRVAGTALPVLLSSGMSSYAELDRAVELLRGRAPFAVLQCTSAYPSAPEQTGLNVLADLAARYGAPVGLSDHSGTIFGSLAAVTLGAAVIEVHVTLGREMFGPDVPSSVTTEELRSLVAGVDFIHRARTSGVDKDEAAQEAEPLRKLFTKSIVASRPLEAGTTLTKSDLALKKPGGGLGPDRLESLVGRRLRRDLPTDAVVAEADVE